MIAMVSIMMVAQIARAGSATITGTKHNLTSTGSGTFKTTTENAQICVFCHTPHFAADSQPLWNRSLSTSGFTPYTNVSLVVAGQPTGVSAACLSCHDGTVGFDTVLNKPGSGGVSATPDSIDYTFAAANITTSANAYIGQDISNDHPISIIYGRRTGVAANDLVGFKEKAAAITAGVKFFGTGSDQVECASCHSVHSNTNEPFLRLANAGSALCLACHDK
jgi:predicted CXXCH cytochrome family protein